MMLPFFAVSMFGLVVSGCGEAATEQTVESTGPIIDARYQTANALVNYAKDLLDQTPPDVETFHYELFYWENEDQQVWELHNAVIVLPNALLSNDLKVKFGETFIVPLPLQDLEIRDTTLTNNEGGRAEGVFYDTDGRERVLHLVEIEGRWWISGYTFEYAGGDFINNIGGSIDDLNEFNAILLRYRPVVIEIRNRLHNGEFKTIDEANRAFDDAIEEVKEGDN